MKVQLGYKGSAAAVIAAFIVAFAPIPSASSKPLVAFLGACFVAAAIALRLIRGLTGSIRL